MCSRFLEVGHGHTIILCANIKYIIHNIKYNLGMLFTTAGDCSY